MILIQLLTGKTPWLAKTEKALAYELATFKLKDVMPRGVQQKTKEFIERTLERDVSKRMGVQELKNFVFELEELDEVTKKMTESVPVEMLATKKSNSSQEKSVAQPVPQLKIKNKSAVEAPRALSPIV